MKTSVYKFIIPAILLLLTAGCASQRTVVIPKSYSILQFEKLSRHYHKTVYTKSGDYYSARRFDIEGDSILIEGEKYGIHQSQWDLPLSEIRKISLRRGPSWAFIGFAGGLATGLISAASLFNQDVNTNIYPTYGLWSFIVIPPLTSVLGLVIGSRFDQPKIYEGDYLIATGLVPRCLQRNFCTFMNARKPIYSQITQCFGTDLSFCMSGKIQASGLYGFGR